MHQAVHNFLTRCKAMRPDAFRGRVLDCGSLDMNGSAREHFAGEITGIDWRPGPGVDVVSLIHEYREKPDGHFDAIACCECAEHDPYWRQSLGRMMNLLRPGGNLIVTFAGPGREAHCLEASPLDNYYKPLSLGEYLEAMLRGGRFDGLYCEDDSEAKDVRVFAWGKK